MADDVDRGERVVQLHWQSGHFTISFATDKEVFFLCGVNNRPTWSELSSMSTMYTTSCKPMRTVQQILVHIQRPNSCMVVVCAAAIQFCLGMSMQDIAYTKNVRKSESYAHMGKCLKKGSTTVFPTDGKAPCFTRTKNPVERPWRLQEFVLYHSSHALHGTESW